MTPGVDILAEVTASVRVGRPDSTLVTGAAAWGFRYPAMPVSGFHVVLRGYNAELSRPGGLTPAVAAPIPSAG
ncbi:hypothetical protein [Actinoplanes sp. NPDC049265]|uniref:hypothetical protein n=1 Tax=Actinoplanes sp. NPDC049265 TaxID=3363902 RepID=UPI0037113D1F